MPARATTRLRTRGSSPAAARGGPANGRLGSPPARPAAIPARKRRSCRRATSPTPSPSSDTHLVLVVEDEESIREVIRDVLEDRGFLVKAAPNGAEALRMLETVRPDVVVLDLLMPVMHGWDFMESYVEKTGGHAIPI